MLKSEDKILSAIAHIGIFFNLLGLVIAAIIYIIKGNESSFVNFSAKQAIGWQIVTVITSKVVAFLTFGSFMFNIGMGLNVPKGFFGLFSINGIVNLFFIVFAVVGAIKALNGERYKYPFIGDFVARI